MKWLLSAFGIIFLSYSGFGQSSFIKKMNSGDIDAYHDMKKTSDGGWIATGQSYNNGPGIYDVVLTKFDSLFNIEWNAGYGDYDQDIGYSVIETTDSCYAVAGKTTTGKALLLKVNKTGSLLWSKELTDIGLAQSVQQIGNTLFVMGFRSFSGDGVTAIFKYDLNGNLVWGKQYGNSGDYWKNVPQQMITTYDDKLLISGTYDKSFIFNDEVVYVTKIDTNGTVIWNKTFDLNGKQAQGLTICESLDSGLVIGGTYNDFSGTEGPLLIKTDSSGAAEWAKVYVPVDEFATPDQIIPMDDGYCISGYTGWASGYSGNISYDMLLMRTDSIGTLLWAKGIKKGRLEAIGRSGTDIVGIGEHDRDFVAYRTVDSAATYCMELIRNFSTVSINVIDSIVPIDVYNIATQTNQTLTEYALITSNDTICMCDSSISTSINTVFDSLYCAIDTLPVTASGTGTVFTWLLDNDTVVYGANALLILDTNGIIGITLINSDSNCHAVDHDEIVVEMPPVAAYSYSLNYPNVVFSNNSTFSNSYLWDFGNGTTSTLSNPNHNYLQPGSYLVCLTTDNACGVDSICQLINLTITALQISKNINTFKVYPNPFNISTLIIFNNPWNNLFNLEIYDILGNRVRRIEDIVSDRVILEKGNLTSGIYFIELKSETQTLKGKIMVE